MRNLMNSEWIDGYTQALKDLEDLTNNSFMKDLVRHKSRFTYRNFRKFLKCLIEHRREIRENIGKGGFIRCIGNGVNMNFEYFL